MGWEQVSVAPARYRGQHPASFPAGPASPLRSCLTQCHLQISRNTFPLSKGNVVAFSPHEETVALCSPVIIFSIKSSDAARSPFVNS